MPNHYVSDLRDLLAALESSDSAWNAGGRLALFLGAIVAWTTSRTGPRDAEPTNVVCGWRSARGRCSNELLVDFDATVGDIAWSCPACGTTGVIRGWEGSAWDRRSEAELESNAETWSAFERAVALLAEGDTRDAALAEALGRLALPAVRLDAAPSRDAEIAVAACKAGGAPDLPTDEPWPEHQGQPLPFVAQLSLSELAGSDPDGELPADGELWFFFDANRSQWGLSGADAGLARVIFRGKSRSILARREAPAGTTTYRSYRWTPLRIATLPRELRSAECLVAPRERPEVQRTNPFTGKPVIFPEQDALPGYREPADDVQLATIVAVERFIENFSPAARPRHQVLGHPLPMHQSGHFGRQLAIAGRAFGIGGDQWIARSSAAADPNAPRWRLLLQLASECEQDRMGQPLPGLEPGRERQVWADGGVLYWLIRDDDLAARRFDRVWVAMDCG